LDCWTVGHPAAESMAHPGYGFSHIPIHHVYKAWDGTRSAMGMGHSSRNWV